MNVKLKTGGSSELPKSLGVMVRAAVCEAKGPGFNSSSDQKGFFSLFGYKEVGKNGSRHDKLRDLAYPYG